MHLNPKLRLVALALPAATALAAGAFAAGAGREPAPVVPVAPPSFIVDSPRPQVVEESRPVAPGRRHERRVEHTKPLADPFEEGRF